MKLKSAADLEQSLVYFDKAIASDPSSAAAFNGRAGALKTMGRRDEAIADWEKAAELDHNFALPVYNLAVAYLEKGDKARALGFCQKYLEIKGRRITEQERRDIEEIARQCRER